MNDFDDVSLAGIQAARERIRPFVHRTPLERNRTLTQRLGAQVFLKLELFQKTGSFKVRGAFNKVLSHGAGNCGQGLVAVSGGNHAQAVAYTGSHLGVRTVIVMPSTTPANYLDATRAYGAELVLTATIADAFDAMAAYEARGWLPVHPFDDPLVIEGQGTVGLEILEDCRDVTDIVLSIGGGGLMAGVATAVKSLKPGVRIWGVETEGADAMAKAWAAGHPVQLAAITSIARTLGAPAVSDRTLRAAQMYLESVTVVPDREAVEGIRFFLERVKLLTEPAAACTLAAAERLKANFHADSQIVLVVCGGNLGMQDLQTYLSGDW